MKKIRFFAITFLLAIIPSIIFSENFYCVDEIRTGLVKEEGSWSSKEIKELKFTVKLEGIKMDFKLLGEKVFSGCNDFKYDKLTDIYQCSNFALGWGEAQNIYYEVFSFSPSKLRFLWSYLPGYIIDKKDNTPMVGGGTCSAVDDFAQL